MSTLAMECPIIVIIEDGIYGGFTIETTLFTRLRSVVSWNIERGLRFSAILDFLGDAKPDLILLHGVDLNLAYTAL